MFKIFLPIIIKPKELKLHTLGAQVEGELGNKERVAIPNRIYHWALRWDEIETAPGVYNFPSWAAENLGRLTAKLGSRANYQVILGVKTCPPFYRLYPDARNSPPKEEHIPAFARFVAAACQLYNPELVEVWNEPEFSVAESGNNQMYYGGYGADGGSLYGRTVAGVTSYVRSKRLPVKIIAGASLGFVALDRALQFLRDAVAAGMVADYFSWHAYLHNFEVKHTRMPYYAFLWLADQYYKIFPVPQLVTETSVLLNESLPEDPEHRQNQGELLRFWLQYMPGSPIKSVLWYCLANNNWQRCSFVMGDTRYPAYDVWAAE